MRQSTSACLPRPVLLPLSAEEDGAERRKGVGAGNGASNALLNVALLYATDDGDSVAYVPSKGITLTTINQICKEKFNQASMVRCKEMTLVVEAVNYTAYICSQFVENIR